MSSELKQPVASTSLYVLEYYGEKMHSFFFMSYPVNGSWTIRLIVKLHFQFRVGKGEDIGAVLSDPELYPSCY